MSTHEKEYSSDEPLLVEDPVSDDGYGFTAQRRLPVRKSQISTLTIFATLTFTNLVFVFIHIALYKSYSQSQSSSHLPLPAREALHPELRFFKTELDGNPFAGPPSAELDSAWHNLLRYDNIHVPKADLDALNLHSIYLADQPEGVASLSVYHSLHCLKLVRRMVYKEHYHINKTSEAMKREVKHVNHCIEYIRESLMCKPDISLVTFRWINETAQHPDAPSEFFPTNFDAGLHDCAAWEPLEKWASDRALDLYDVDKLERPEPVGKDV